MICAIIISRCLTVWPDLAKFCHFDNMLKDFWQFLCVILYSEKCRPQYGNFYALWQIIIVVNGQICKNIWAIWSHCIVDFSKDEENSDVVIFETRNLSPPAISVTRLGELLDLATFQSLFQQLDCPNFPHS